MLDILATRDSILSFQLRRAGIIFWATMVVMVPVTRETARQRAVSCICLLDDLLAAGITIEKHAWPINVAKIYMPSPSSRQDAHMSWNRGTRRSRLAMSVVTRVVAAACCSSS